MINTGEELAVGVQREHMTLRERQLSLLGALLLEETAQVVDVRDGLQFVVEAVESAPLESLLLLQSGLEVGLFVQVGVAVLLLLVLLLDLLVALLLV